jgi:hypothetical protein
MAGTTTAIPPASAKTGEMPICKAAVKEPSTTESHEARKTLEANLLGLEELRLSSFTRKKLRAPIIAMLNTLAPNAIKPPSPNKNACINSTIVMLNIPAYGPRRTETKVPPTKCPLVPRMIGKLIICAANTKALEIASNGAKERGYSALTFFQDHARKTSEIPNIVAAVAGVMKASGMCITSNSVTRFNVLVLPNV